MRIWLSEFTHRRLEEHMQMKYPAILKDSRGFLLVSLNGDVVSRAMKKWPGNADSAINFAISHNERAARKRHNAGTEPNNAA